MPSSGQCASARTSGFRRRRRRPGRPAGAKAGRGRIVHGRRLPGTLLLLLLLLSAPLLRIATLRLLGSARIRLWPARAAESGKHAPPSPTRARAAPVHRKACATAGSVGACGTLRPAGAPSFQRDERGLAGCGCAHDVRATVTPTPTASRAATGAHRWVEAHGDGFALRSELGPARRGAGE